MRIVAGGVVGGLAGMLLMFGMMSSTGRYIPHKEVTQGYVQPNNLTLHVRDIEESGKLKTELTYNHRNYLFIEDTNGNPVAVPYEITPKQIVQKN